MDHQDFIGCTIQDFEANSDGYCVIYISKNNKIYGVNIEGPISKINDVTGKPNLKIVK